MAREVVEYQSQLRAAHPRFDDCPEPCAERDTDLPDFCAECEVRLQWDYFTESYAAEVEHRFQGQPLPWSFDSLYRDVLRIMGLDGKRAQRGATALETRCLAIVRSEIYRPLRIARWEQEQKARSTSHS